MKQTHYHTLGLNPFASMEEVKQAYRRLAKRFHPDVNPNGKDEFARIAAAYEVLGDSSKKYIYDSRLKRGLFNDQAHAGVQKKKRWETQEQELKRRQYYQEHYKKHYEQQQARHQQFQKKNNYNEYKYILFATPLAVVLVLMMLNMFRQNTDANSSITRVIPKTIPLQNGATPYRDYFDNAQYAKSANRQIVLLNALPSDAVCLIFNKGIYLRQCYLQKKTSATIAQLPNDTLEIRYVTGAFWCDTCKLTVKNKDVVFGTFKAEARFYVVSLLPNKTGIIDQLELSANKKETTAEGFFKENK